MTIDEIIATDLLQSRPSRAADLRAENRLLRMVGAESGKPPQKLLDRLVRSAVTLCAAGSAGLSMIDKDERGRDIFRWVAMAGIYKSFVGGTTPREFSPCGTCLERGTAQLYRSPARYFKYLSAVRPPIHEGLVIPIVAGHEPLGTIWIVSHDTKRAFDSEDARIMTSIATFLATVLRQRQLQSDVERALSAAKRSEEFSGKILSSSPDCIKVLNHEARLLFMNEPGMTALKAKPSDILGKNWFSFWSGKDRLLARTAFRRAENGKEGRFQGYRPTFQGEPRWWDVFVAPLAKDDAGRLTYLTISRDVTERVMSARKLAEANEKLEAHASTLEKRIHEKTQDLRVAKDRLQGLARKMVRSQEDERRSIARELHDEIGQQLTGLKLLLERTQKETSGRTGREIGNGIQSVLKLQKQAQTLSFALRQSLPDHISLQRALQWHFRQLEESARFVVHFRCDNLKERHMGSEVRHTVFRIVQEALTNVIRHAEVRAADVSLQQFKGTLCVNIADRGKGFGTWPKKGNGLSAGLLGMQERVILLGGQFEVSSRKGAGTRVMATIPILNGAEERTAA